MLVKFCFFDLSITESLTDMVLSEVRKFQNKILLKCCGTNISVPLNYFCVFSLQELLTMGRYKVLEGIGEGSFGKVFRGECRETQQVVALKFIPKHLKGDTELSSLRRECEIQRGLFHPNIVLMLDSFETEHEIVAVSEYVPQQLCALLQAHGPMAESVVTPIACNLVSALYYLHSHRIVHRDIKPQNILLTDTGLAKLCDFGFSKKMEINTYVLESIKGTPLYMAPELIEQQPYDQKADLWSLGCILFELLTGRPPFCTNSIVHLIEMVRSKPVNWPSGCSTYCTNFLQGLLQKDQEKRLEWPNVLQHPFVSAGITIVPHNPRIATLTMPLTHSQQQVKEHQKQLVVRRNSGQPNLLPRAFAQKAPCSSRIVPEIENVTSEAHQIHKMPEINLCIPNNICSSLENMSLSIGNSNNCRQVTAGREEYEPKFNVPFPPKSRHDAKRDSNSGSELPKKWDNQDGNSKNSTTDTEIGNRELKSGIIIKNTRPCTKSLDETSNFHSSTQEIAHNSLLFPRRKANSSLTKPRNIIAEECTIEEEEWCHFLHQSIADVMGGNFDAYTQPGELTMFVSPLRSSACPLMVMEKIGVFFMLPFVVKVGDEVQSEIIRSYQDHKVICNLIFACKHLEKKNGSIREDNCLNKEEISTLNQLLIVICHLIHLDSDAGECFLDQLCEAFCVLECHRILGQALLFSGTSSQLLASILAVATQILRKGQSSAGVDLSNIVMQLIGSAQPHDNETSIIEDQNFEDSLRFLLMSLLTHTAYLVSYLSLDHHEYSLLSLLCLLFLFF